MLVRAKDTAVSLGVAAVLRERHGQLVHISRCDLDSRARSLVIHARLRWFGIHIRITVESYRLEPRGVITWMVPEKIRVSPIWMQPWLRWRHTGKPHPLPAPVARLL